MSALKAASRRVPGLYLWWRRLLKRSVRTVELSMAAPRAAAFRVAFEVHSSRLRPQDGEGRPCRDAARRGPEWITKGAGLRMVMALWLLLVAWGLFSGHGLLRRLVGW